jgi:excinuclease ABC subunit C
LVDGGLTQIHATQEALEEAGVQIQLAGLYKNDRHETEGLIDQDGNIHPIDPKSPLFFLLMRMQDEVHRYAITFHRQKRSKHQTASELDSIKGVGESTKHLLLKEFKSVKRIKNADLTQLQNLLGKKKGENLYHAFHQDKQ